MTRSKTSPSNQCLVVVQGRFGSSRLPGKVLYPLDGVPMLSFLLRRLKAGLPDEGYQLVLATTRKETDDPVAWWGVSEGIEVVRGEEDDVLARYVRCLKLFPARAVVRVTADNPLTCPAMLCLAVDLLLDQGVDYVMPRNLPYGAAVDVFSASTFRLMDREVSQACDREHINNFILRNPDRFKTLWPEIKGQLARPDLRMTVDTLEDWQRINAILRPGEIEPWRMDLNEAIERLDKHSFR
ncbi:MAG: hypothetical protein JRC92_11480 [Deltaproteobacteria bacterium]|nr:hypothetical protein [Deltaproteobacteria bacterium]